MSRAGNVTCTGNFTMLKYIDKLSADEMERTIGFDKGRLKTGFLLGSTPKLQQYAILLGAFGSAVILGPILLKLNDAATVYVPIARVAPAGLQTDPAILFRIEGSWDAPSGLGAWLTTVSQ